MSSIQRVCSIENCNKPHKAKNYCNEHYRKLAKPKYISKKKYLRSPEQQAYRAMKTRITNPNSKSYYLYGGRGIKICERWLYSSVAFIEDMGKKPSPIHSIDRIDSNGHYSCGKCLECIANNWPFNCKWSTPEQQVWNRRKQVNTISEYMGVGRSGSKWQANIGHQNDDKHYRFYLGTFDTPEEAAIAYDQAAIFFRGSEAKTNIL